MRFYLPKLLFALFLSFPGPAATAQVIPLELRQAADSLIETSPVSYSGLQERLRPFSRDSLLLNYLIREFQEAGYPEGLVYAYNEKGVLYRNLSRYPQAIENHERALSTAASANNTELRIISLNLLGEVYRLTEVVKTALDYHKDALNLAESILQPSASIQTELGKALNGIGDIYRMLEQYDLAIEYFQLSLEKNIGLGNLDGQAVNYQKIAECLEAVERLEESMEFYQKSLQVNESLGSPQIEIVGKYGMAHVLTHQEREPEALALLESVLPAAEALDNQEVLSSVYIHLGWVLSNLGRAEEATDYLNRGLEISQGLGLHSNIYQANTFLRDLSEERGAYQEALERYKEAQGARREINNNVNQKYVSDALSRDETENRLNQIEILSRENEIVRLKLRRNRTTLLVGALLLVLFTLILYILYRQYQLNSEKKMLTLEQSMLRAQMNPHFLFNSLNSIKLYIINNEQKNAVHYLNKFSKLVRKILEASSLKEIPLEEELETVKLYMNIENIRFNGDIDFEVAVAPDINTSLVKIPSLILQPFLENALWHGLSSKKGPKEIRLEISRENPGYITVVIRDNGIGREAAEQLKEHKVLKRKSVGIDITRERLMNFSRDYQNTYDIRIKDLFDENGKPAGTEITLIIPTI